jgi:hypothetical protein
LRHLIISLRIEVWANENYPLPPPLDPTLVIEVPVPSQESARSCISVLWVSILSVTLRLFNWMLELFHQWGNTIVLCMIFLHSFGFYDDLPYLLFKFGDSYLVRANRMDNQELIIQKNWQHWVHKTEDKDKQKTTK